MLAEMLLSALDIQDRLFQSRAGEDAEWAALVEKQRRRLTQIRQQIFNLAADLQEFMQLYEIERHGTEVDINALLTRLVKLFKSDLFFKHHVECELHLAPNLPHIKAPGKDLVPAVFHLLQNGVTALHTSPRKVLLVNTSRQGEEILLQITDSGAGLPEGVDCETLFDLFVSKWETSESKDGSADPHLGFGLYAARQLLLPYGFEVGLAKSPRGTTASIRMPLRAKPA